MGGKRKTTAPPFTWFDELIRKSPAWLSLSRIAIQVYLFLRSKTIGPISGDAVNKDIKKPYSIIAKETLLKRQQVRDALLELDGKGFIDLVTQGGMKSGGYSMNVYRLSKRFLNWNTTDFKAGTMKREKNVQDRGWGAWHKHKASMKKHTAPVRKTTPVADTGRRCDFTTGMKSNTCSQNTPV